MQMRKITLVFLFAIVLFVPISSFAQTTPWHDNTMSYRHQITVNSAQVSGNTNLVNFPVLVSIQNGSNLNSNNIQSSGADIRFYDNSGNNLDFEIESFTNGITNGSLVAWVRIPSLSATTDSIIWLYHGNDDATDAQNTSTIWDDYRFVSHMSDDDATDSTDNNTALTVQSTSTDDGKIGKARIYTSSQKDTFRDSASLDIATDTLVMEMWMNTATNPGGWNWGGSATVSPNQIFHLRFVYADNLWNFYVDNILQDSVTPANNEIGNILPTNENFYLGGRGNNADYVGMLDEVRISTIVQSNNWYTTEFNNQNSPNTFLIINTMENRPAVVTTPTTPTTTQTTNQNYSNSIDGGLFILMLILSLLCFMLSVKYGTLSNK